MKTVRVRIFHCILSVALCAIYTALIQPTPVLAKGKTLAVSPSGAYQTIADALAVAESGDTIEVTGGIYPAPLILDKSLTLIGINQPVIDGHGSGSLVLINASEVTFQGFTLRNSGHTLEHEDSGIVVQATHVTVANNILENVLFGIYFANASDGVARNNIVHCIPLELGIRGDGFRAWYSNNVSFVDNEAVDCRDMFFWYSDNLKIQGNYFHDSRYALHFMYNNNALVQDNRLENSSVGSYLMYSDGVIFRGNTIINNRGASGYGIALKDTEHFTVADNVIASNQIGMYIDNSTTLPDSNDLITGNVIAYNDIGITALPNVSYNKFQSNSFIENTQQASTNGRGNLLGNTWSQDGLGNYWSDYAGYDANTDGIGDMPYRSEKLFESLADSHPALRLFIYSPATQALDFAASAFPSLRPEPKLIDDAPMMNPMFPTQVIATDKAQSVPAPFLAISLLLIGFGSGLCWMAFPRSRKPNWQLVQLASERQ